ncbi:MAG: BON domain-containing protein [Bryobacterales bacterium]|nr:BON domain-containing protein [Bryobacterales bacterium]
MKPTFALLLLAAALPAQDPAPDMQVVQRMARAIQKEIYTLPAYGVFDDIRFSIKDGVVTLKGLASRPTLKSSAENVTKKVEGVQKVVNNIEILPLSRNDDQIRARTYLSVYGHPALQRYSSSRGTIWLSSTNVNFGITQDPPLGYHAIHIIVKNGNVTLEGAVDNAGDRAIAEIRANGVPGVFAVENRLAVLNDEVPSEMKKPKKQ